MNTTNSIIQEVSIRNPIGNLYRKNHVLVLVVDEQGNFILGKKKDFYPEHIARMLGGGIKDGEGSAMSAQREIFEELGIDIPISSFKLLGNVTTKADTLEGYMEMLTWIYKINLPQFVVIKPSDDISGVQKYTPTEYSKLTQDMLNLIGEFKTDKYSFEWSDWGKIYGPIHVHALEWYKSK